MNYAFAWVEKLFNLLEVFGMENCCASILDARSPGLCEYRYRNLQPTAKRGLLNWQINGELEIRIPLVQKFWLRLLPQDEDEAAMDEIITKIPELDKHYVIHATQQEAAIDFLRRPSVRIGCSASQFGQTDWRYIKDF